ncbi:MAG: M28 family peptidase [Chloroflexi bacterium]|nr:M28 family peptidase [Chloroflexota bacterium]
MPMKSASGGELEAQLLAAVSADELWRQTESIARWQRHSGTREEREAFDYIAGVMRDLGLDVKRYDADALIGLPGKSSLEVVAPESLELECITHSYAAATGPDGRSGELVFLGGGRAEDYVSNDVRGKIAVLDGLAMPDRVWKAEQAGAIAQIYISDEHLHEMCISTIWGVPTPETSWRLPRNAMVSVRAASGNRLRELAQTGPVRVRIRTSGTLEWTTIPVLTADLVAPRDPEHFVLFSGHVDSWYYGAMDNGSANATMIEVARLLSSHRGELRRGIRFGFWSGHSHGRYAGSAWYADNHWRELRRRCVAHVNVDSTGGKGATLLSDTITMAESYDFAAEIIKELSGQELGYKRANRSGDQSFWGVGVPSLFMSLSHQPASDSATSAAFASLTGPNPSTGGSGGLGWWWHTPDDTLDKLDRDNMVRDAKIYVATLTRLCTAQVLPFDYSAAAQEIADHLTRLQSAAGDRLDLSEPIGLARELETDLSAFRSDVERRLAGNQVDEAELATLNESLVRLGNALIPLNYSKVGPFDHDLAVSISPVPTLAPAAELATLDPASREYRFLKTRLVRERNKMSAGLDEARAIVRAASRRPALA